MDGAVAAVGRLASIVSPVDVKIGLQPGVDCILFGLAIGYQATAGDVLHPGQPDAGIPFQLGDYRLRAFQPATVQFSSSQLHQVRANRPQRLIK